MSKRTLSLSEELHDYVLDVAVREPDVLRRLREETGRLENSRMQISPDQGQLMRLLVGAIGARRALEVGVFTGYSALSVALALPEDGKLVACDVSEEWTAIGRRYWQEAGVTHKIDLRLAPAIETLDALLSEGEESTFDFAFIDADKVGYARYLERALRLVRRGGLILFDNTLWGGRVIDPEVNDEDTVAIRSLNRALADDERVDVALIPIGDGVTALRRR